MHEATNILLHDDSEQAETLGDASLIAMLTSITILHQMTGMFMTKSKKRRRDKIYQCIKRKRRTIPSLYQEYGGMFSRAYQMDYDVLMSLHELLKPGIDKYVCQNNNSNNEECFYRHNGAISSKIHLTVGIMVLCRWFLFGYNHFPWDRQNRCLLLSLGCGTCNQQLYQITVPVPNHSRRVYRIGFGIHIPK